MYPLETRELAVEAVAAGFSLTEAAELAGCSRTAVVNWAKAAGVAPPPRKKAVYLPFDRKMELVARLEAGERAADLAAEAGVTAAAVSGWRRRLREEGALSLMTDSDIAARAPEPREAPSELEELRARCEELELRNAVLEGTIDILKKDPGADLSALTAAERAALADRLRGRFGLRAALAALSLPRSTFYDRLAAASAPDPYAALRPLVRAAFEASGGAYGYRRVSATAKSAERATLSRRRRPRFPAGGATALWPPALPRAAAQGALDRGVVEVRGPDLNLQRRGALGVPGRDRPARDLPSAELREPDRHRDVLCAERGQPPRGVRGPHDCPLSGSPSPSAASASRSFMR